MEPGSREEKNALAFLDYLVPDGKGYKLRPISLHTLQTMQTLEMAMIAGNIKELDPEAVRDELNAYAFIQVAPVPRVARAARAYRKLRREKPREECWEDWLCDYVEPFIADLSPQDRAELEYQLETFDEVDAAQVVAMPPRSGKTERHDPNSLSPAQSPGAS